MVIANQVYSDFNKKQQKMVGGDIVAYSSKCLIELLKEGSRRKAVLKKHRSLPNREAAFEIKAEGLKRVKKNMFGF